MCTQIRNREMPNTFFSLCLLDVFADISVSTCCSFFSPVLFWSGSMACQLQRIRDCRNVRGDEEKIWLKDQKNKGFLKKERKGLETELKKSFTEGNWKHLSDSEERRRTASMMSFSTQNPERESFNLLINSTSMKFPFPRVSGMNVWKISKHLIYFYSQPDTNLHVDLMMTRTSGAETTRRVAVASQSHRLEIDGVNQNIIKQKIQHLFTIVILRLFVMLFFYLFLFLMFTGRSLEGKITKWARWNRKEWDDFCKIYYLDFELSHNSQLFGAVCSQTRDSIEKNSHRFGWCLWVSMRSHNTPNTQRESFKTHISQIYFQTSNIG